MRACGRATVLAVLMILGALLVAERAPADLELPPAGTVITDFGGGEVAFALVLQPDGKLVAAGQFNAGDGRRLWAGALSARWSPGRLLRRRGHGVHP